jgi:hypothetical protein
MSEIEAKAGRGLRSDLRHDNYTVSLLTDYLVFSPKYRGKVCPVEWWKRHTKSCSQAPYLSMGYSDYR